MYDSEHQVVERGVPPTAALLLLIASHREYNHCCGVNINVKRHLYFRPELNSTVNRALHLRTRALSLPPPSNHEPATAKICETAPPPPSSRPSTRLRPPELAPGTHSPAITTRSWGRPPIDVAPHRA